MSIIRLSPEAEALLSALCLIVIVIAVTLIISTASSAILLTYGLLRKVGIIKKPRKSAVLNIGGKISKYGGLVVLGASSFLLLILLLQEGIGGDLGGVLAILGVSLANFFIGREAERRA